MVADRDKATGELTFPNLEEKECWMWSDNWDRLHPETLAWHERCHFAFSRFGFAATPMLDYRRRYFPGGVAQLNAIPNTQIQGGAASICNQGFLRLVDAIPYRGWSPYSGTCCQMHDYLGVFVPRERALEACGLLEECMKHTHNGMTFRAEAQISWTLGQQ